MFIKLFVTFSMCVILVICIEGNPLQQYDDRIVFPSSDNFPMDINARSNFNQKPRGSNRRGMLAPTPQGNPLRRPSPQSNDIIVFPSSGDDFLMSRSFSNAVTHRPKGRINEFNRRVKIVPTLPPGVVSIDTRFLIKGGGCPLGYTRYGGFCYKDSMDYI